MIRLLQNFDSISLDAEALAPEHRPPASWAMHEGRQGIERFCPKIHLTLYAEVSVSVSVLSFFRRTDIVGL